MDKHIKKIIYTKINDIDSKHVGSWNEDDLVELGEYCYKAALKDIKTLNKS